LVAEIEAKGIEAFDAGIVLKPGARLDAVVSLIRAFFSDTQGGAV